MAINRKGFYLPISATPSGLISYSILNAIYDIWDWLRDADQD